MNRLLAALLLVLALPSAAGADVFIGRTEGGTLLLTNLPRAGQHYRRVVNDSTPQRVAVTPAGRVALTERPFAEQVSRAAQDNALPAALLHAVILHESNYDPAARSPRGAAGLMQLMPATATELGVKDVWDPADNIEGGARYLKSLLTRFDQDLTLALAAYNAGPGAVLDNGRKIPPYPETQRYVPRVLQEFHRLQEGAP